MTNTEALPITIPEHTPTVQSNPVPSRPKVVENLTTWNEVVSTLDNCNGVAVFRMEALREIDGYGRLGVNVRQAIVEKLASLGVGIIREQLPTDASANVILMRLGTPASEIVGAIRSVTANEGRENYAAEQLRKLNQLPDPQNVSNGIVSALRALGGAIQDTNIDVRDVF